MLVLGHQHLRKQIVTLGVVGPRQVEVAARETASLVGEQLVVDETEPLDLLVGGDAVDRDVAVLGEERDLLGRRRHLERRGGKRRKLDRAHSGFGSDFGRGFGNVSRMCLKPAG